MTASGGTGGADTTGGSGGARGEYPSLSCDKPPDLGVHLVGRYDGCTKGAVSMSWSGSGFVARFEGTGLNIMQSGAAVYYTVVVDGVEAPLLATKGGEETIEVVSDLPNATHVVEVYRQGEANLGVTHLSSVDVLDGTLLEPTPVQRRIEIFGDSITCGYGNEGTSPDCGFSAETENHYLSYGALLARKFGAELSTVAWSGKGVVVNYGGDMSTTLPEMLDRGVPNSEQSVWDYAAVVEPQAVIINLGTNDFSTDSDPSAEDFQAAYLDMLERLRLRYPTTFILCTVGPLLSGSDLDRARTGISAAVQSRNEAGDDAVLAYEMTTGNENPGCDWHPGLATHEAMAEELSKVLSDQHVF